MITRGAMQQLSDEGKMFLVSLEGICLSPYLDSVGVKTIGIGATVSEIPDIAKIPWTKEYTMQEVFALLDKGLKKYVNAVNEVLGVVIPQHQFDALVSMTYNIGTGRVKAREGGIAGSTAMRRINNGESLERVGQAMLMWNKPPEIIGRRKKEVALFTKGDYGDGKAQLFPVSATTHKPIYKKSKIINVKDFLDI